MILYLLPLHHFYFLFAGLEYLHSVKGNRKIAILGDMLNLGDYETELHEKIGEEVVKSEVSVLITVGKAL